MKAIEASLWTLAVIFVVGLVTFLIVLEVTREPNASPPAAPRELRHFEEMEYINFDGHEYVKYRKGDGNCSIGGIAHSPKCPCGNISKHHL